MKRILKKIKNHLLATFGVGIAITGAYQVACNLEPKHALNVSIYGNVCIEPFTEYTYRLGSPLEVVVNGETFTIPAGFETDLASIPRWYWMILAPQYSAFVAPSIVHDYFYRCANLKDRAYADSVFYYALLSNGVSYYTASKFYAAVRLFGAHSYSKDKSCEPQVWDENEYNDN